MQKVPEINKIYDYFDDGKIRKSRREICQITQIIAFEDADSSLIEQWLEDTFNYDKPHWLYAEKTDFFVKADLYFEDGVIEKIVFVRTVDGGWFSLGWWAGRLDIDGSLFKLIN